MQHSLPSLFGLLVLASCAGESAAPPCPPAEAGNAPEVPPASTGDTARDPLLGSPPRCLPLASPDAAFATPHETPQEPPPPVVVSLTFDDTFADQKAALPILRAHGLHATFFVNSTRIGATGDPALLTLADLRSMAAEGHEIGGHTLHHLNLTLVGDDEALRQICDDRARLLELGFAPRTFAYPLGANNAAVRAAVATCGYEAARITNHTGVSFPLSRPPADRWALAAAPSVGITTDLDELKAYVTDAEASGTAWVPIVMHHVCDGCDSTSAVTPATFEAFVEWLAPRATRGTVVRTISEVMGTRAVLAEPPPGPAPPSAPSPQNLIRNGSLEDEAKPNVPACWVPGVPGANTPYWTRTTDAHDGAFAMRLDQTSGGSSSTRRLNQTQDSGGCAAGVSPGAALHMSGWYKSTGPIRFTSYRRDGSGFWSTWRQSPFMPASDTWVSGVWELPPVPADTTAVTVGVRLDDPGVLTIDDLVLH